MSITYGLSADVVDREVRLGVYCLSFPYDNASVSQYIAQAEETLDIINKTITPGTYLADYFPICTSTDLNFEIAKLTSVSNDITLSEICTLVGIFPERRQAW